MITSQSLLMATPSSLKCGKFTPFLATSKTLVSSRPSTHVKFKRVGLLQFNDGIKFNPLKIVTKIPVARADASHIEEDDDDKPIEVNEDLGTTEPDADLVQQQKSNQLVKRVVFGLGIGISAGGVVLAGGWVFSVALAAAVFAGSREYFELVRSRGIASGMTPPPRYLSRVCSVICALMPLFTLYKGQVDVSVTSAAFIVAMALLLQRGNPRFSQLSSTMFGLFYCGYLPSFWVKLRCRLIAPALNTEEWEIHGLYY